MTKWTLAGMRNKFFKRTYNWAIPRTPLVDHPRRQQALRPSKVLRLPLFLTFGGEHSYLLDKHEYAMDKALIGSTYPAFFLPRPFGFGCESKRAAYSGS